MSKGLRAFLAADLRQALAIGVSRTPEVPPEGIAWLRGWALCCLAASLTLYLSCGYHGGFLRINAWAAGGAPRMWEWLTVIGDERVPFALSLLLARRYPQVFWALVVAGLAGTLLTHAGKHLFDALRPAAVLDAGSFNLIGPRLRRISFPSGHSATAAVFFGVVACYARPVGTRAALTAVAVLVGLSRVAVGAHWPVDVAAGLLAGTLAAWLGVRLADRFRWGSLDAGSHLAFVTLAVLFTLSLTYWDGGYGLASAFLRALGIAGLGIAALSYLALPLARWLRAAAGAGGQSWRH